MRFTRLLAPWRDQRGLAYLALVQLAGYVSASLLAVAALVPDPTPVNNCLQMVSQAEGTLRDKYQASGVVPPDEPAVTQIQNCKNLLTNLSLPAGTPGVSNVAKTLNSALVSVGACSITSVTPNPADAGSTADFTIGAEVPLLGTNPVNDGSDVTVGGTHFPLNLVSGFGGQFYWTGDGSFPVELGRAAGGTTSIITVKGRSDVGRLPDGTCPSGTDASTPGQCISRVFCSTGVPWQNFPPQILLFQAFPTTVSRGAGTPVTLTWATKNASTVTIDQGVGEVTYQGFEILFPPDQNTTYTLTTTGPTAPPCAPPNVGCQASTTVTVQAPPTVQLTAPANNDVVLSNTVAVSGTVQNAVPGQTVQISLNGANKGSLTVVNGTFAGSLTLAKTLTLDDFFLNNLSQSITTTGSVAVPVTMGNSKTTADVTNVITASIGASSDTVTVSHAVQVTDFQVAWSGCPSAPGTPEVPQTIGAGQSFVVGFVECGASAGFCQTCTVHVSVATTVGSGGNDSTWVFRVPPCPAVSSVRE